MIPYLHLVMAGQDMKYFSGLIGFLCLVNGAQAADLSGDWLIEAMLGQAPIRVNCTLVHTGDELSGECVPVMENPTASQLTGTVSDDVAQWGYDVVFNGASNRVDFNANSVSDAQMSGTLSLAGNPVDFIAHKI